MLEWNIEKLSQGVESAQYACHCSHSSIQTHCLFHIPNSMPVRLSPRYFSVPLYRSLEFIYLQHIQKHQGQIQNKNV